MPGPSVQYNTKVAPTWCPGCGDFGIWTALKSAFNELGWPPHEILVVYGIGCSGNMANTVKAYGFHGLHGRPIPVAAAAKIANRSLHVVVVAGDGDTYGEGLNHFISAIRANHEITLIVHDNQVYGLTKGQTAPTSEHGFKSDSTPEGVIEEALNPLTLAIAASGTFVAQGFAGNTPHLTQLLKTAMTHKGFGFVNVLQPCVTYNHHNTFQWFYQRVYLLPKEYNPKDRNAAFAKASEWGEHIPLGIVYRSDRPSYEDGLPQLVQGRLLDRDLSKIDITKTLKGFA